MIPSRPVYCWKKQRAKATHVDLLNFLSHVAYPRVTLLEAFEDLPFKLLRISSGSSSDE